MNNILKVNIESICLHSEYSDEPHGSWSAEYNNSLSSVKISKEKYGEAVHYTPKIGQTVYVLWAEYSSGDSFGYGVRNNADVVYVFDNIELAIKAKKELLEYRPDDYRYNKVITISEDGKTFNYFVPWLGYFENLDELHIDTAVIGL